MNTPELPRPLWRKSTYSGGDEGECIELAPLDGRVGIRDSKNPSAGHLTLTRQTFAALITRLAARP
ncbi:DUF397 domain-containing protein [Actinomadura sp. NPDC000929]|uniref:DUF397 domain-containing protein n=1 Tax=Actinomadura sp. NPDC000929 TaxID=3154517 RepID=UPI003391762C